VRSSSPNGELWLAGAEIEPKYKIVFLSLACVLIAAGVWYAVVRPMEQINRDDLAALQGKKTEIAQLMPFQARITQLNKEIETYRQQIEQQKQIVPEDKQVDGFIRMMQTEAHSSRHRASPDLTAMPVVTRDFYSSCRSKSRLTVLIWSRPFL